MKNLIIVVLLVVALGAVAWAVSLNRGNEVDLNINVPEEENTGSASDKSDLIVVETPQPNSLIGNTFLVKGKARGFWFFEGSFPVSLVAADGTVLVDSYIMTDSEWMTEDFVPFQKTFTFQNKTGATSGTLILRKDNPSGLPQHDDSLRIPVRFAPAQAGSETMNVKVYFNKPILATESCDDIQSAVTRTIPKTESVARAAILELLKGPTNADAEKNLNTSIPSGTVLNKIEIRNGTAYADFNSRLEQNAGGSCSALAIRAQIEDTLKQFSTVKSVVISIDGRTEDILQP